MSVFFTNDLFKTRYEQVLLLSALTAYPQRTLHLWPLSRINSFCQLSIFQLLLQTYRKYSHCPLGLPGSLFPSIFPCKMFFLKPSLLLTLQLLFLQKDLQPLIFHFEYFPNWLICSVLRPWYCIFWKNFCNTSFQKR